MENQPEKVNIKHLIVGERYGIGPKPTARLTFIVSRIDRVGIWVEYLSGTPGLFYGSEDYTFYKHPLHPLEKELL